MDTTGDHGFGARPDAPVADPLSRTGRLVVVCGEPQQRVVTVTVVVGSVVIWVADFVLNPNPSAYYSSWSDEQLRGLTYLRYAVVPSMMLLSLVPLAAAVAWRGTRAEHRTVPIARWVTMMAVVVTAVVAAVQFVPATSARSSGPRWSTQVREAEAECAEDPAAINEPIELAPEGWVVDFPCTALDED